MARLSGQQIVVLQQILIGSFDGDGLGELLLFNLGLPINLVESPNDDDRSATLRILTEMEVKVGPVTSCLFRRFPGRERRRASPVHSRELQIRPEVGRSVGDAFANRRTGCPPTLPVT